MKEIVYNNNDYDVYVMGDSTIITPKGHGGQLMSAEALLLALKNNRGVTSYPSLIDEVRVIIARHEDIEGTEVIIVEDGNIPLSIEGGLLPNPILIKSNEYSDLIANAKEYIARKEYDYKPVNKHRHGKKSWSRDNRKKR